jgi:endonuclease/exonuclease/phosphatase family metal-dependent hydrolase
MTYNVLWGGGVDREFDSVVASRYQVDRLPAILDVIRGANPDILAVQEAAGWDRGGPSVAQQVATELGMHYVVAKDDVNLNIVLFSRYPIESAQYTARRGDFYGGFNGVLLMAQVVLDGGRRLNVLAPHLNSQSPVVRTCQTEALIRLSNALPAGPSVLLGDMNSRPTSSQNETLRAAGWQFVSAESTWTVDQIWAGPGVGVTKAEPLNTATATRELSDHLPVGAKLTLSLPAAIPNGAAWPSRGSQLLEACPPPAPAQ